MSCCAAVWLDSADITQLLMQIPLFDECCCEELFPRSLHDELRRVQADVWEYLVSAVKWVQIWLMTSLTPLFARHNTVCYLTLQRGNTSRVHIVFPLFAT